MASPIYNFHFPLALLAMAATAFIHPALSDGSTQQLIDKICRSVEEYAFCSNTFNQNIKGSSANITALTQITVEQALNNATNTHSFIVGLLCNTTDPAEKNALTTCENAYRLVTSNFNEATMHFFEGDYGSMLDSERRSPRAQESCITIFSTPPTPPNPVADRNRQMRILIAMAVVTGMELTSKLS
ncbi:hypothetical protein J1N35_023402 [Gossypium stocksii]|uniref:Pectinesterase inhibitor domain-containing protein n=1 Tax=Gossypium stocksii TaxID=47602 RepID=A0A9D3VJ22_9ROSI|nr:hypothetical protein J1N35_023402 [Gossypium stocksii]